MYRFPSLILFGSVLLPLPGLAQQPSVAGPVNATAPVRDSSRAARRQLAPADLAAWRSIRNPSLSPDGKWFVYQLAPNEGDAEVVIRSTGSDNKELRFPIGELPGPSLGAPPGVPTPVSPSLVISGDSKWVAFTAYPTAAEAKRLRQTRRPSYNRVLLLNLATGAKREFEKVRRFAFNGDHTSWLALQGYPADAAPAASGGPSGGGTTPPARGPEGTDLLLVELGSGATLNIGNVNEFGFDESGDFLAYTIDARDQAGNGVQLRNLKTDVVKPLDSERALYRRLAWSDTLEALAVLRGRIDSLARDTVFAVVGFTGIAAGTPKQLVFDAREHSDFPAAMRVSSERAPRWSEDLSAIFFGIREAKPPAQRGDSGAGARIVAPIQPGAPGGGGTINQPAMGQGMDDELPSLVLWHWKDPRLQPQQIVEEGRDKSFSFLTEYRVAENKVLRLTDSVLRSITLAPHDRVGYGIDTREYDQPASYNGRRFGDIYTVELRTGERRLVLKKQLLFFTPLPSPDGRQALYYGEDAEFHLLDFATGETRDFSKGAPVSFANSEDDHNNLFPPPRFPVGWTKDAAAVLLSDGWDVWKLPVKGGGAAATNLTGDGKRDRVRYQRRYVFDPKEKGIDLGKPQYFGTYGEWTKREGLAVVEPGKTGARALMLDDVRYNVLKAKNADTYLYTRQTFNDYPDYYVAAPDFKSGRRLTDANPQQKEFAWSSGTRLINYVSDKGDSLQGALYLPAGYEPGKQYPLLVTIYEKLSQNLHAYRLPNETSTPNPSLYTSRGYAVLEPDIVYRVNDPGMSAVWCVVPAVKAAIATGIVDPKNVGLWGHSWGGYQTAFLVTQTDIFKSAVAGAPLTDLVSMYSSIYWNTGGTNQAIFEASQGRFKGNFTDNYDAYIRNSPVFQAKNVKTPLVILHNDKDGAVDFNQGVTYFNTLRQLGKEVIMLEYVGENHGLAKPVNQKDYAVRMREWFDTYLKGEPAPDWMKDGIPRLKMEEHLKGRQKKPEAPKKIAGN